MRYRKDLIVKARGIGVCAVGVLLVAAFVFDVAPIVAQVVPKKAPQQIPGLPSPQGRVVPKKVLFADCMTAGSYNGMWVMDSTGDTLQHVSSREGSASWAPDGIRVVCIDPLNRLKVLRIDKPGESFLINLPEGQFPKQPAWSPNGDIIAYSGQDSTRKRQIYIVNADSSGSGFRQLTFDTLPTLFPAWHPDGKRLLITHSPDNENLGLYHVPIEGGPLEPVYPPDSLQLVNGVYSPDGKYIVAGARGSGNIVRVDVDGSNPINVTKFGVPTYPFNNPRFGKSSERFYCSGRKKGHGSTELYEVSIHGHYLKMLTDPADGLSWTYCAPNK